MKSTILFIHCIIFCSWAISSSEKPRAGWECLFDGKNLDHWMTMGEVRPSIEDGEILAIGTDQKRPGWLVSKSTHDDFLLQGRVWSAGKGLAVFFRAAPHGAGLKGYQAEFDFTAGTPVVIVTGPKGEELGRGSADQTTPIEADDSIQFTVLVSGSRMQIFLNGAKTVDAEDEELIDGVIALSPPAGQDSEIRLRDIRILDLESHEQFEDLFTGDDVENGWRRIGPEEWTAQDGIIVGRTKTGKYGWLATDREYSDFVLVFRYRWTSGNSGVQFRSWIEGEDEMHGYQADIDPSTERMTGMLYDEHERGILAKAPPEIDESFNKNRWHYYEVSAIGNDIRLFHDGVETVHFVETDPERTRKGIIALQVHSAPVDKGVYMEWRDLRLLNLEPPSPWE